MSNLQSVDSPRTMSTRMGGPWRPRFESARGIPVVIEAEEPLPSPAHHEIATLLDDFDRSLLTEAASAGHLIDDITTVLHRNAADDFVVDVHGGMRHSGTTGLHVALRHPEQHDLAIGVVTLTDQALCAWSPATEEDVIAVWVAADEAAAAEALCAALLVTPPRRLSRFFRFSYVRLFHDGRAEVSRTFPGALFAHP